MHTRHEERRRTEGGGKEGKTEARITRQPTSQHILPYIFHGGSQWKNHRSPGPPLKNWCNIVYYLSQVVFMLLGFVFFSPIPSRLSSTPIQSPSLELSPFCLKGHS